MGEHVDTLPPEQIGLNSWIKRIEPARVLAPCSLDFQDQEVEASPLSVKFAASATSGSPTWASTTWDKQTIPI